MGEAQRINSRRTKHARRGGRRVLGTFEYRSCLSKTRYSIEPPLPNASFRAYPCDFCGGWHLTKDR